VKIYLLAESLCLKIFFEFENAIILYYGRKKSMALQHRVLKAQVGAIAKVITSTLKLIVSTCVLN
jgi:hypothetical protein